MERRRGREGSEEKRSKQALIAPPSLPLLPVTVNQVSLSLATFQSSFSLPMSPLYKFEHVPGFFHQDVLAPKVSAEASVSCPANTCLFSPD